MSDGGDGELVDYSAADLPVEHGTAVAAVSAGPPGDDFHDLVLPIPPDLAGERLQSEEEDLVALTWVEPDTTSGP
ncbi:hypothetical protein [Glycomyces algeriensis]|uniref:Uncharacterized protein n=1 Tax=Glycomyces algeriensis TaxID=256037 RepID=A0A9W6GAT9_9ACTN|nr:hypothetical protein [Glycomyces algeriensis]MDA1364696.1 hypothetical protein [Glycomyces algeriensis]MDR7350736.1 hypothetical protein [Glycomyces algeriensis]GLI43447.1 hypothetical protein GALLR39Z86_32970 [Glycomyces algeriensis]